MPETEAQNISVNISLDTIPNVTNMTIANIGKNATTITWKTDKLADSQIEYGLTSGYGTLGSVNSTMALNHSYQLTGLSPGTMYHFRILSANPAGYIMPSADFNFSTVSLLSFTPLIRIETEGAVNKSAACRMQVISSSVIVKEVNFTTNSTGDYQAILDNVPEIVNLRAIVAGYLSRAVANVNLSSQAAQTIIFPPLLAGDLNSDNTINSLDYSQMNGKWFLADALADLNRDGIVNALDFSFMNKNWMKSGE